MIDGLIAKKTLCPSPQYYQDDITEYMIFDYTILSSGKTLFPPYIGKKRIPRFT